MPGWIIKEEPTMQQKLAQMREDARFDVSDDQDTDTECIPDLSSLDVIHSQPTAPKVPKLFVSNDCRFNCAYCGCRCSHDKTRYCHDPKELAKIAVDEAIRNRHGVFVTSAICRNADYTEELIVETIKSMRRDLHYTGYIHAKVMPGADPLLIEQAGRYANRLSVNIEVAKSEGYDRIAKQKNRENILTPMGQISRMIQAAKGERRRFAVSQTTQLMAGSTGETDRTILTLSEALYRKYQLNRVYYTAFQYVHPAKGYDLPLVSMPKWRPRRLYQADRLLKLYGFTPEEIVPESAPDLDETIDPKVAYAIRQIDQFPVEVNTADYEQLLRVPGIGIVYAKKILEARKFMTLTHASLQKIGVPLKRCRYFILCNGRYTGGKSIDHPESLLSIFREDVSAKSEQLAFF